MLLLLLFTILHVLPCFLCPPSFFLWANHQYKISDCLSLLCLVLRLTARIIIHYNHSISEKHAPSQSLSSLIPAVKRGCVLIHLPVCSTGVHILLQTRSPARCPPFAFLAMSVKTDCLESPSRPATAQITVAVISEFWHIVKCSSVSFLSWSGFYLEHWMQILLTHPDLDIRYLLYFNRSIEIYYN